MEQEPAKRQTSRQLRRAAIAALVEREQWALVDLAAWDALRRAFGEVTENTLRHDLLDSGLPLDPLVEGVRFDTIEHLARSLTALAVCHRSAMEASPNESMSLARKLVLEARRKAEAVLGNSRVAREKREAMEEKFLWLRTWLENPEVFAVWAPLRLQKVRNPATGS